VANTQAICTTFKYELMKAVHALGTPPAHTVSVKDVIKAALFLASATINAATTVYSTTGEVSHASYTAGGVLYNSSQGDKAIAAYTFGSQTITAGTFTLTMPVNDGTTGLLRLA
jgi:hypothetical protein